MMPISRYRPYLALAIALLIAAAIYSPGLSGSFFFDDHPNIVDNKAVQPGAVSLAELTAAALSSPSSDFKRPLSSLTFAANFLASGLSPFWFKLTNLFLHLANGALLYFVVERLWRFAWPAGRRDGTHLAALLVTAAWLVLPINLTAVLYIVQRMESLANLFVLSGLLGYLAARRRMMEGRGGLVAAWLSLLSGVAIGSLAKETAVMLPLYAATIEYLVIRPRAGVKDRRIDALFLVVLVLPIVAGACWLSPKIFATESWAHRDFTLGTRLLTEARVVVDYLVWSLIPTPRALSFYHDDFSVSTGLLSPWTTLASLAFLLAVAVSAFLMRRRNPTYAAGIALFLGAQLLTATVLPLELVYEHRNYFASGGLLIALVSLFRVGTESSTDGVVPYRLGVLVIGVLAVFYAGQTLLTSISWGDPLKMAAELAWRAPDSPRAQYELGRTYIIYSRYKADSPFTPLAYAPLERAAALPDASILPLQALVFFNARLGRPIDDRWWLGMTDVLRKRRARVEDESSLISLTQCLQNGQCDFPAERLMDAYQAALSHPEPSGRLLGAYGDFAWNMLQDRELAERVTREAIAAAPTEPAYRITLARMLIDDGDPVAARRAIADVAALNFGGRLQSTIDELDRQLDAKQTKLAE